MITKKPMRGIIPIEDSLLEDPFTNVDEIYDIIFPEGGLPPIVSQEDEPVSIDLTGEVSQVLRPTPLTPLPDEALDYFYTNSSFQVAASAVKVVPFPEYLSGKDAKYIRLKSDLPIVIELTTDDESVMQVTIEADKPWWMRGLNFRKVGINNTANTVIATLEVIWSSKEIDVVQEQNINLISDSPDIYTPLSVVMTGAGVPVTANVLYSTLQTVGLRSDSGNGGVIYIGDATLQVPWLTIGQSSPFDVRDLRNLYAYSTVVGDVLHIIPLKR